MGISISIIRSISYQNVLLMLCQLDVGRGCRIPLPRCVQPSTQLARPSVPSFPSLRRWVYLLWWHIRLRLLVTYFCFSHDYSTQWLCSTRDLRQRLPTSYQLRIWQRFQWGHFDLRRCGERSSMVFLKLLLRHATFIATLIKWKRQFTNILVFKFSILAPITTRNNWRLVDRKRLLSFLKWPSHLSKYQGAFLLMLFLAQNSCAGAQLCADRFLSPSLHFRHSFRNSFFQTVFPFLDDCFHWQYLIRNDAFTSLKCSVHSKEKDRQIIYFRFVFAFEFLGYPFPFLTGAAFMFVVFIFTMFYIPNKIRFGDWANFQITEVRC